MLGYQSDLKWSELDDGQTKQSKVRLTKLAWCWLASLVLALFLNWILGYYSDNATELTPDHSDILDDCLVIAGIVAVASALVCILQSEGPPAKRAMLSLFCFGLFGGMATFLLLGTVANIIEMRMDFPPETTDTYWALLPIDRAYRMDSRTGPSWIIQPVIWTNIDISHADYRFMLSRSDISNKEPEPDNIPSRGRFCAKVEIEQAGKALGVLHAGDHTLPSGTVGVCSEMTSREPSLKLIS